MEYLIKTKSIGGLTEEQFYQFCRENETIRFEMNPNGDIIIREPTWSYTGLYNQKVAAELYNWNKDSKAGLIFDSSSGFTLPNGAVRSPDVSFVSKVRWNNLSVADKQKYADICPDFVVEIRSESEGGKSLRAKMKEWIDNGCILAWMIDPKKKETFIYRQNGDIVMAPFSNILSGEDVLPGFTMDLTKIFTEE
jgi:Uma2 family endonuclease